MMAFDVERTAAAHDQLAARIGPATYASALRHHALGVYANQKW